MLGARSGKDRQRGAALVEMAIVLPLLVVLVFGIIEFGMAFNVRLTVGNATQSSARVGSTIGSGPRVDIEMLDSFRQGVSQLSNADDIIEEVWIFKAPVSGNPPLVCDAASLCTPYVLDTILSCNWTPCPDPDEGTYEVPLWDPDFRSTTVGSLDDIGVVVYFSHTWITGGLLPMSDVACASPPNGCWNDTAIMRLEPKQFGLGG